MGRAGASGGRTQRPALDKGEAATGASPGRPKPRLRHSYAETDAAVGGSYAVLPAAACPQAAAAASWPREPRSPPPPSGVGALQVVGAPPTGPTRDSWPGRERPLVRHERARYRLRVGTRRIAALAGPPESAEVASAPKGQGARARRASDHLEPGRAAAVIGGLAPASS